MTNTIDELAAEIDTEDPEVLAAHVAGARKLSEWEAADFGLARHEDRVRLFDDDRE